MIPFDAALAADRRLIILQALDEAAGYRLRETVLGSAVEALGAAASRDRLRADLVWLAEQGLIELDQSADVWLARITARGLDVAQGRADCPGVARPLPGGW